MSELYSVSNAIKLTKSQYVEASTAYTVYLNECTFLNKMPRIETLKQLSGKIQYLLDQRIELEALRADLERDLMYSS